MAAENDEGHGKQAKHKCVLFRFGNDRAAIKARRREKSNPWLPTTIQSLIANLNPFPQPAANPKLPAALFAGTKEPASNPLPRRLRSWGGLGLPFLSHSPMKENKAQRKEGENEGIFFWFGDDLAVDPNLHRAVRLRRKMRTPKEATNPIVEGSRKEVADGFVDDAGARPSRRLPAGIRESAPRDANPHVI